MVTNMWSGVIKNQDWKVQYDHIYEITVEMCWLVETSLYYYDLK